MARYHLVFIGETMIHVDLSYGCLLERGKLNICAVSS